MPDSAVLLSFARMTCCNPSTKPASPVSGSAIMLPWSLSQGIHFTERAHFMMIIATSRNLVAYTDGSNIYRYVDIQAYINHLDSSLSVKGSKGL